MQLKDVLRPGDVLLYRGTGVFSWLIRTKTWSTVSHCEGYVGAGESVASRDGLGVAKYPLRLDGLHSILRPETPFDLEKAQAFFRSVDGQRYDWLGLLAFVSTKVQSWKNGKMFCSEFLTLWQREGGVEPFDPNYEAAAVSPGMFLASPAYKRIPFEVK